MFHVSAQVVQFSSDFYSENLAGSTPGIWLHFSPGSYILDKSTTVNSSIFKLLSFWLVDCEYWTFTTWYFEWASWFNHWINSESIDKHRLVSASTRQILVCCPVWRQSVWPGTTRHRVIRRTGLARRERWAAVNIDYKAMETRFPRAETVAAKKIPNETPPKLLDNEYKYRGRRWSFLLQFFQLWRSSFSARIFRPNFAPSITALPSA